MKVTDEERDRLIASGIKPKQKDANVFVFKRKPTDLYKPYSVREVEVSSSIADLIEFALSNGSNYHELKTLNPWLRKKNLDVGEGQTYTIYFPATN